MAWGRIGEIDLSYFHSLHWRSKNGLEHRDADVKILNGEPFFMRQKFGELPSSNPGVYEARTCAAVVDQ